MTGAEEDREGERSATRIGHHIAVGRGALADRSQQRGPAADSPGELGPVAALLALLWHGDPAVRRATALALPHGDRYSGYIPPYGHFAGAFLRHLTTRAAAAPETAAARYQAVVAALRALLDQNTGEIRAMSNMSYSFLGNALYLALLSTCQDVLEAVRRLRAAPAHTEICRLLWNLACIPVTWRVNGQDLEMLARTAGTALAALPPDEIPEYWRALTHRNPTLRTAVAPALTHLDDARAVPYLVAALEGQPPVLAEPIIACLGRLGDPRALPALTHSAQSRDRQTRHQAKSAIAAIRRAHAGSPVRTLLRPADPQAGDRTRDLLRSAPADGSAEPPDELLRSER